MAKQSFVPSGAKIKVIGMGGGGCNAITRMVREGIRGVEFIAMNTDAQGLSITEAAVRIGLGERLTRGLGAGGDNHVGQKAAEESKDEIKQAVSGADMVFLTCGMGGGTGTGTIPLVAQICKQSGALTIAICTKPFGFEGSHRLRTAEEGIADLVKEVDTLVIIPNDKLLEMCDQKTNVDQAFKMADEVLCHGVQAIAEVITVPGLINLDFADIRSIMKDAGPAWMSIGKGSGQNRAKDAAKQALSSPLLEVSMRGAKGVLFNVAGDESLSLMEVNEAAKIIQQEVDPSANIIFGVKVDPLMGKDVRLTLIATGFAGKGNPIGQMQDKEINRMLKAKTEEELDVPSFMRYRNNFPGQYARPAAPKTQVKY
jgi:cell division protein FtsZ